MAFYPSKANSLTIAASGRPYNTTKLSSKCDLAETTNFTSSGYQSNEAGVFSLSLSFSGPYDGSEGLAAGDSVAVTYATGGGGPSFGPTVRIRQIDIDSGNIRNGVASISVEGESNGSFSITI